MNKTRWLGLLWVTLLLLVACGSSENAPLNDETVATQACYRGTLRQGHSGTHVRHAQTQLLKVGNAYSYGTPAYWVRTTGGADGYFGGGTKNAVVAYQRMVFPGQPSEHDGIIGSKTWDKLGCASGSTPVTSGSSIVDNDRDGLDDNYENRLLRDYAPRIYLHSSEANKPVSVSWFINRSSMRYSHNNCGDDQVLAKGTLTWRNLEDQSHNEKNSAASLPWNACQHNSTVRRSNSYKTTGEKGFFIDVDNSARSGSGLRGNWVVYGHVYPTTGGKVVVQWWQLYTYNDSIDPVNHEGDWEHSGIVLNASGAIEKVFFFRHGAVRSFNPSSVEFVPGTNRHVTYSAKGSHAQYMKASSSSQCIAGYTTVGDIAQAVAADRCNKGFTWNTWDSRTFGGITNIGEKGRPLNGAEWINYSGLWGEIGSAAWAGINWSSGPLTPSYQGSAWKPF